MNDKDNELKFKLLEHSIDSAMHYIELLQEIIIGITEQIEQLEKGE